MQRHVWRQGVVSCGDRVVSPHNGPRSIAPKRAHMHLFRCKGEAAVKHVCPTPLLNYSTLGFHRSWIVEEPVQSSQAFFASRRGLTQANLLTKRHMCAKLPCMVDGGNTDSGGEEVLVILRPPRPHKGIGGPKVAFVHRNARPA